MAFTARRGRPPKAKPPSTDPGTAELRLKHALGLTTEPIDQCLAQGLITRKQHWCGMHLRWLYTLRYGAPNLTTRYEDADHAPPRGEDDALWRHEREAEYRAAIDLLKTRRLYEPVMRLCIYNDLPIFLNKALRNKMWGKPNLAHQITLAHRELQDGLDLLVAVWKQGS